MRSFFNSRSRKARSSAVVRRPNNKDRAFRLRLLKSEEASINRRVQSAIMSMWTRFPPRMRRAMSGTLELAASRGCIEAATEHLLLAILRDAESAASFLLNDAGVSREALLAELE